MTRDQKFCEAGLFDIKSISEGEINLIFHISCDLIKKRVQQKSHTISIIFTLIGTTHPEIKVKVLPFQPHELYSCTKTVTYIFDGSDSYHKQNIENLYVCYFYGYFVF